jgi:hypothetical protein
MAHQGAKGGRRGVGIFQKWICFNHFLHSFSNFMEDWAHCTLNKDRFFRRKDYMRERKNQYCNSWSTNILSKQCWESDMFISIRIFHPGSRIPYPGSKRHRIPDPDPQHWYDPGWNPDPQDRTDPGCLSRVPDQIRIQSRIRSGFHPGSDPLPDPGFRWSKKHWIPDQAPLHSRARDRSIIAEGPVTQV